jgi:adenine-specific DNA-methyltransferase
MPTLHWIGKEKVINHYRDVPFRTLEHKYRYPSVETGLRPVSTPIRHTQTNDVSGNKIIHGDNLEALKALLPEYEGKVKCIAIDPPYNTGNENWIYNDNVNDPKIKKWLAQVVGKEGEDLSRHDKWLCMMYPRLQLLHKLLSDDGVIFVCIDDNEQANLKLLMDEIFGARNFLGLITRKQSSGSKNDTGSSKVISTADYILPYKKNSFEFLPYKVKSDKKFNLSDDEGNFSIRALEMQGGDDTLPLRSKMGYSIYYNPLTKNVKLLFDYDLKKKPAYAKENSELLKEGYICYRPRKRGEELGRWRWGLETFIERFNNNQVYFDKERVYMKERQVDFINKFPEALLENFLNTKGTNELKEIFETKKFDFPKPSELIQFLLTVATSSDSIILDSFAGSGTTAHAVLNLNKEDGGNRKFILIEMEEYAETITAERVKRVISGYADVAGTGGEFDYYELGEPLFVENNLNPKLPVEKIREYIYFMETKLRLPASDKKDNKYLLGVNSGVAYYFFYNPKEDTELDYAFLKTIKTKADEYIIYADNCLLTTDFLQSKRITFKKIPREIPRI